MNNQGKTYTPEFVTLIDKLDINLKCTIMEHNDHIIAFHSPMNGKSPNIVRWFVNESSVTVYVNVVYYKERFCVSTTGTTLVTPEEIALYHEQLSFCIEKVNDWNLFFKDKDFIFNYDIMEYVWVPKMAGSNNA